MTEEKGAFGECYHRDDIHPPIYWNPYNKVFQCHKCGEIFVPNAYREAFDGMVEALEEIRLGQGPYKLDPLEHAAACIESMKETAEAALAKAKKVQGGR